MAEERFAAARVAALVGVAKTAYIPTIAAGGLLLAILWDAFPATVLLAWFGALLAVTMARMALHRHYLRDPGRLAPRIWEARFAVGAIAAGALWTIPSAVVFPAGDQLLRAAAQLALQPGRTYQLLALLALVFGIAMIRVYRDIHGYIVGTLRARTENEELLARVARSEAQLRDVIESFPEGIAVYDAADRLVVCNEIYAQVYGG